ncbi:prolipoprotein diacylglyceryl transferase [Gymnodinialimonas ulvae]|uniref:prolipoprotein diacylglyceryl transferase n=1 Tax=Gymnodinialimonas ulvae TaxID=3126504 RepID=UPI00309DDC7F
MFAIPFPPLSPELFSIEIGSFNFALRWYALAYLFGLGLGWWVIWKAVARPGLWPRDTPPLKPEQVEGLLTAVVLGVILGGRVGYVLFYQPGAYADDPLAALRIWEGGMSFHGGLAGVAISAFLFCRMVKAPPLQIADAMSMVIGIGLLLGRLANFVNAELWGRASDAPWAVIFPGTAAQDCAGPVGIVEYLGATVCARHPSQLYEALLEGAIMGALLLWLAWRRGWLKRPGALTGLFLLIYGASRFLVEFFRQPDAQFTGPDNPIGFALALSPQVGLTMGQILTLPMLLIGLFVLLRARHVS